MIKQFLPKGLFGRTFLIVMVPVFLLQMAVSFVFFDRHWSKMTERLAYAVSGEISAIIDEVQRSGNSDEEMKNINRLVLNHLDMQMMFVNDVVTLPTRPTVYKGNIAYDLRRALNQRISKKFQVIVFEENKQIFVDIILSSGLLTIIVPEGRLFSSSSYIFILWMIGLSLLLFTIAMIFMRNQIRPIYRLGLIAERLGRGIPVGKIRPSGASEVRQAAEAFIQMQSRIKTFISQRTTMLAGVSHDLRTPLTRMKLQLELLDDGPDVAALRDDIKDMEAMIEGYLSFAKGDGDEEMERCSLQAILDKVADDARRMGLNIHDQHMDDDITIWAKPTALTRVFANFISNANRHADTLRIQVIKNDNENVTIIFEDNGDGIAEARREDMLKPFIRGEESRNQKTGGVGLGLTIANDIILSHGGDLMLGTSDDLGGLSVAVKLPV